MKTRIWHSLSLLLFTSMMVNSTAQTSDEVLLGAGSDWRYNDTGTDLGTSWRETGYNDQEWE